MFPVELSRSYILSVKQNIPYKHIMQAVCFEIKRLRIFHITIGILHHYTPAW